MLAAVYDKRHIPLHAGEFAQEGGGSYAVKEGAQAPATTKAFGRRSGGAAATHQRLSPEQKATYGINPGLVRLSVGLADVEDIIADLARALENA